MGFFFDIFVNMINQRKLLGKEEIKLTIRRLCQQLIENHSDFSNTVLIGIQPRGSLLCKRIISELHLIDESLNIISGNIDISFHRDDIMRRDQPILPKSMDIDFNVEEKNVVLIDDVLFTGRTIRSAMDTLMLFGRANEIELLTLIDRKYSRHLPIEPNYVGKTINTLDSEKIIVEWKEISGKDKILILSHDE